ncbi:type IV pilus biogenesis/stability protein PilW [Thiorhodococcus mannitoliphagus]|uniref:Type IV pilus biogenesis/stability protein PilW n=1 Tax=Thiorhodococcus mannitoliphagus TaxID=329406 RepID=A0A6P1DPV2_9GAMM|nr:type IV pilus biogenesis/stability protein PilW [Thiorhodococcus mannitoliphagus]NEX19590.1 type IV pilus biogenesis/stability protein PilW [Thiorhodococcus mannitoliphagus]
MTSTVAHRLIGVLGLCLMLAGCASDKAYDKADQELGLEPEDSPAELYVKIAEEYYKRGQIDVAFRRAQQAVEADSKYPRAQIWIAFLLDELRQPEEAAKHYQRAIKLAPNNSDILNAYASFLCNRGSYDEADTYFKKAIENPVYNTPWVAMWNAGTCAAKGGNTSKAETYYRSAIQESPAFGAPLVGMAELAMKRGDAKAAKGYIDRYFQPETWRTAPAVSYQAFQIGAQAESRLGNRKRAAFYEAKLKANFRQAPQAPQAPTSRDS